MKIRVDERLCLGFGICEAIRPDVFDTTEGVARVRQGDVPPEAHEACRQAADYCLAHAIIIEAPEPVPCTE